MEPITSTAWVLNGFADLLLDDLDRFRWCVDQAIKEQGGRMRDDDAGPTRIKAPATSNLRTSAQTHHQDIIVENLPRTRWAQ